MNDGIYLLLKHEQQMNADIESSSFQIMRGGAENSIEFKFQEKGFEKKTSAMGFEAQQ